MTTGTITTPSQERRHSGLFRFFFVHEIDEYPTTGKRTGYLALAILATIALYYTYYTQTGVTPNILRYYHMSFAYYVGIVVVSNLIGAFASLPASLTDRLGRANVIIYGLLIVGLLIMFGVPATHTSLELGIVLSDVGLVEGAILVATPAMVRDYSPQLGRASAMGFWTIGPVAGSLITSVVANRTLDHFHSFAGYNFAGTAQWKGQFVISGLVTLIIFVVSLFLMKDLSSGIRDQLMVSAHDRALVEARARGLSEEDLEQATRHPWRQILKWDLAGSAFGIAVFLLIYYVAASFFTIYYAVTFVNANGTSYTTSQVNGLNAWFWGTDIVALIVVGIISDALRVRKPLMLIGALGGIGTLIWFLTYASHPHTPYWQLALTSGILAVFLSFAFAPWIAGYTETVEAKNPALVATGLALWGWILRLVVGISFIFLPVVIGSVNHVVDNSPYANQPPAGVAPFNVQLFTAQHPQTIAFATQHAQLLSVLSQNQALATAAAAGKPGATAALIAKIGVKNALALQHYQSQITTLILPYQNQLNYLSAHQAQLAALQAGQAQSPSQWQHWFWVDIVGMIVFIPLIWLTRGRWSPKRARRDADEHEKAVAAELAQLLESEASKAGHPA